MSPTTPLRLAVLVGSTREGRRAPMISSWFLDRAAAHPGFELDVIDLAEIDLPATWTRAPHDGLQAYAERIAAADAYVVVTPEYNHSFTASVKHAIDLCMPEWKQKVVGFVSYGGISGGLRAVEQLRLVFVELQVANARNSVSFNLMTAPFDDHGTLREPDGPNLAAVALLDELAWWGAALRVARNADADAAAVREAVA